ncbi:MAG: hypothetical protein EAZ57_00475 [Cytophagales bacterium]|nr:MAG: hypothetical protein EAZ67_00655 [Cytophagales bacterium]TAF62266.1 MAG: hypothetical protein EAZ57_00475 [Cytophagales bacterium]
MQYFKSFLATFVVLSFFFSCSQDDDKAPLNIPTTFNANNYTTQTTVQAGVRSSLAALTDAMKTGRKSGVLVELTKLQALKNAGTPSLTALSTAYYNGVVDKALVTLAASSGNIFDPSTAPSGSGGVFGEGSSTYLFDKNGLEQEQVVEKGLFAAALYNHFITLKGQPMSESVVNQMVCIYGAHPNFPNTNTKDKTPTPDQFLALYAARRDKNDGKGFYTSIRDAFIKAQAAALAGSDYQDDYKAAISSIQDNIEKSQMATVINYCFFAVDKLKATSPSVADRAAALHAYGEAIGFLHGWRTLPAAEKRITDAQIDELLVLLKAPVMGEPQSYLFLTKSFETLPDLLKVSDKLQAIYSFTPEQMTDFRNNWIAVQGR